MRSLSRWWSGRNKRKREERDDEQRCVVPSSEPAPKTSGTGATAPYVQLPTASATSYALQPDWVTSSTMAEGPSYLKELERVFALIGFFERVWSGVDSMRILKPPQSYWIRSCSTAEYPPKS